MGITTYLCRMSCKSTVFMAQLSKLSLSYCVIQNFQLVLESTLMLRPQNNTNRCAALVIKHPKVWRLAQWFLHSCSVCVSPCNYFLRSQVCSFWLIYSHPSSLADRHLEKYSSSDVQIFGSPKTAAPCPLLVERLYCIQLEPTHALLHRHHIFLHLCWAADDL